MRGIQALAPQLKADQISHDIQQQSTLPFSDVMDIQIGAFRAELDSIIKDICEHGIETEDDRPLSQLRELTLKLQFPIGGEMTPAEIKEVLSERDELVKNAKQSFPRRRWQEFRLRHSGNGKLQTRTERRWLKILKSILRLFSANKKPNTLKNLPVSRAICPLINERL